MSPEEPSRAVGEERYGVALALILFACITIMAAPENSWWRVIILSLEGMALVASARAAEAPHKLRLVCGVLVVTSITVAIIVAASGADPSSIYVSAASAFLALVATPIITIGIIRQVKAGHQISIHTMLGVLCIYLLMCLAFASAFGVIQEVSNVPFFIQGGSSGQLRNFLYFSITTITTLGLGDFSPATNLGRSLTAAEALIGQIYLVTVVAVIVGNLGRGRKN